MVMDQASWHIAGDLAVPQNMGRCCCLPTVPELNPAERLRKALREDCFANPAAVERALTNGLVALEADPVRTRSMTGFKWITSISLNAT